MIKDEIFRYSAIVWTRTLSALKNESNRSYLGYVWFLIEPVINTAILYLVFGVIVNTRGPDYVLFLLIGLTVWQWFDAGITEGMNGIKAKLHILNQIPLPKHMFPTVQVLIVTLKFLFAYLIVFLISFLFNSEITWSFINIFLLIAIQFILILGVSLPLSVLAAYSDDIPRLINSAIRLLFFVTGIFFSAAQLPETVKPFFYLNPMAGLIEAHRAIIIEKASPSYGLMLYALLFGLFFHVIGLFLCQKVDKKILKSIVQP